MEHTRTATTAPSFHRQAVEVSQLGRDSGCAKLLNWRCDLPPDADRGLMEAGFRARDYRSMSKHPALKVFRHPDGHELAWVADTGRVQIRVAIRVEPGDREAVARTLYSDLVGVVSRERVGKQ